MLAGMGYQPASLLPGGAAQTPSLQGVDAVDAVVVRARSGGDEEVRAREAGMDGFLRKPVSGDQLAAALAEEREAGRRNKQRQQDTHLRH